MNSTLVKGKILLCDELPVTSIANVTCATYSKSGALDAPFVEPYPSLGLSLEDYTTVWIYYNSTRYEYYYLFPIPIFRLKYKLVIVIVYQMVFKFAFFFSFFYINPQGKLLQSEVLIDSTASRVDSFSSRGPNGITPDILKVYMFF